MEKIAYYRVHAKNNRAYWCPTVRMQALGFEATALGFDGPEARAHAMEINARWQQVRKEKPIDLGRRDRPAKGAGFVYFLQAGDRVKIGFSNTPLNRAAEIAGGAHARFSKVLIVTGSRRDETRLHDRFASYRSNGEWFVAARPLQLTITRSAMAGVVVHDGPDDERWSRNFSKPGVKVSQGDEVLSD